MKTIKIFILTSVLLLTSVSCKKFVEGYYKDPNGVTFTVAEQEMTAMMLENQFFHKADGMRMALMWMNQATGVDRQYLSLDDWNNAKGGDFDRPWNEVYLTMDHADIMMKLADKEGNTVLRGLGKLFEAWAGGEAASLWGDVPFSQLNDFENYPDPVYDSQAQVFQQAQDLLDEAIADLSSGTGLIKADRDIYFEGNPYKWVKIAHAVKARLYLHSGQYDLALSEALLGPSNVSDDLYAKFDSHNDTPFSKWNPTKQFVELRSGDLDASESFANNGLLKSNSSYTRNNTKTNDKRRIYNYGGDELNTGTGANGTGKFFGDMPLITYGEMLLIATEATLRNASNANRIDDALNYYNTYRALLASGEYAGGYNPGRFDPYDASDFAPGGIENTDNIDQVKAFFREIFEERYVFFIGDYESFIDFSRSFNDPDVPQYMKLHYDDNGDPKYNGQPLRFIYPQTEEDANANYPGTKSIDTPLY